MPAPTAPTPPSPPAPAGKRTVSKNASTHHAYSADLLLPGEHEPFFHAHRQATLERLCPMDALELALAERVVGVTWRLRRLQAADHFLTLMEDADLRESVKAQNQQLEEFRRDNDDFDDDDPSLPPLPPPVELAPEPFSPGFLIARALRGPIDEPDHHRGTRTNSPFERLLAAEQRLQGMMHRALNELRRLQADRRDHPHTETCPFLTPDPDDDEQEAQVPTPHQEPDAPPREGESPSEPRFTRGEPLANPVQGASIPTNASAQNDAPPREGEAPPEPPVTRSETLAHQAQIQSTTTATPTTPSVSSVSSVAEPPNPIADLSAQNKATCQNGSPGEP